MAFLANLWSKQPATPTPAPAVEVPGAAGPASKQQAPANPGANPSAMTTPATGAPAAPGPIPELDGFRDLFKPKAVDPNAPKRPTLADPILAPLDPAAFQQQVQNANFAASIPKDILTKAAAGDADALAAAINHAAQSGFAAATQLSHGLVEHGARTAAERGNADLDVRMRNQQIRMHNPDNPVLRDPAVAPVVGAIKSQIAQQNPSMSAEQVTQAAEQYFQNMAVALTKPTPEQTAATVADKSKSNFRFLLEN